MHNPYSPKKNRSTGSSLHIVLDMTYPRRLRTGSTVYANEIVAALRAGTSHRITCVSAPDPVRRGGIWRVWNGLSTLLWIQLVLPAKLLWLRADLLHAPSYFAPLLCPCPLVLTVHDMLYLTQPQHYKDRLFSLYARVFIKGAVRRAHIICTGSAYSKEQIKSAYGMTADRIRVTHYGVHPRYEPQPEERLVPLRTKYRLDRRYFLFVGAWDHPRKNLPRLIRAFRLFCENQRNDYELILVGPEGSGSSEVHALLSDPEAGRRVRALGFVPDGDMPGIYAAAEAFVFPSLGEGFGLPVIEAMACGTPVMVSRATCLPEVAGDAAVFFDPEDPADIARAMRLTLRPDLHREMKQKGLRRAEIFTWENAARETQKAYADALNRIDRT